MFYPMKQVLLATVLVCMSTAGCSPEKLEKLSVESVGTSYLELETIRRVVGDQEAFMIVDLTAPSILVHSMKYKVGVECKENKTWIMESYAFTGRMGEGNVVEMFSKSEDAWLYDKTVQQTAYSWYPQSPKAESSGAKLISRVCSTPSSLKNQAKSFLGLYVDPNDKG